MEQHHKNKEDNLGPLIKEVLANIKNDCRPLFRLLPDDRDDARLPDSGVAAVVNSKGKSRGKQRSQPYQLQPTTPVTGQAAQATIPGESPMPMKWVMLRWPWQGVTPEESVLPVSGDNIPSKVMTDWVKGMLRRCFGKDTFAMTLLQQGYSPAVLAEYKVQDDLEHNTQSVIGKIGDIPLYG